MPLRALILALFATVFALDCAAAWQLAAAADGRPARAVTRADSGAELAVYLDNGNTVYLEFTTVAPGGLGLGSCPTFQVDARVPQHYYKPDDECRLDGAHARYALVRLTGNPVKSLVLYRLLNGNEVAFRYLTRSGSYHQDIFSLSRSKQALLGALGRGLTIDPDSTE